LSEIAALRKELEGRFRVGDLVSHSQAMRPVLDMVPSLAASSTTVLIQGETGTGKELLAKAIHGMSPRSQKPFVAVNCGALPDTLLESELFGYKKVLLPVLIRTNRGVLPLPRGEHCFWMKSEKSARPCR